LGFAARFDVTFAQYSPTLQTDATTYAAGDEIGIRGQGFAPHEPVTLAVTHEDGTAEPGMGHESEVVTADESGSLTVTWAITAADTVSRRFVVHAVGAVSGAAHSNVFQRTPVVTTDKDWYVAGEVAPITGRDFIAGETVTVRVIHADGTDEPGMAHESA